MLLLMTSSLAQDGASIRRRPRQQIVAILDWANSALIYGYSDSGPPFECVRETCWRPLQEPILSPVSEEGQRGLAEKECRLAQNGVLSG